MPVTQTQDQLSAVSTNVLKQLMRAENMGTFTTALGDDWVDPLDTHLVDMMKTLKKNLQYYSYTAGKSLTTVSYELYGTTSAWWIILYLNGYMHPDEISDGATLKVPSFTAISSILNLTNAASTNVGQSVTI